MAAVTIHGMRDAEQAAHLMEAAKHADELFGQRRSLAGSELAR